MSDIILENGVFRLVIGEDAVAKSLVLKGTGEELLAKGNDLPFFSVTQERPYNNEIKLIHMNRKTTFSANRVRMEEGKLIIGFEIAPYEAVVAVKIAPAYIAFTLEGYLTRSRHYWGVLIDMPPALSFRLCQLPVREKKYFGEWLNAAWDESSAVCVLATSTHAEIDGEKRREVRILTADAHRDVKMQGCGAALIASPQKDFLAAVADIEEDYDLPRGVASRRDAEHINASIYWSSRITPETVDEHIAYAKRAGFRMMLLYYTCIFKEDGPGGLCGNYDLRDEYEGSFENLRRMLDKIKAAGITVGLHFLQTYIGLKSRYVTPIADPRLYLKRHLTLAKPLGTDDTEIVVMQDPTGCPKAHAHTRALQFGGELITYEGYTTEPPYTFTGCVRGAFNTVATAHEYGQIGGVPEISEFGFQSVYLDQNTDLQDEVAAKLARAYDCGFEFVYFDGSEGTNTPFAFHIANAQHRVYRAFGKAPLLCEGAAKTHFGWHMLSGANAFDVFKTKIFKEMIDAHPVHEAPLMRRNFTRVNFGWWAYYEDTRPDIYEYGMSRAAAWDCPATMQAKIELFASNPRTDDNLEVIRRWEDVRRKGWLTEAQKEMMRSTDEHILLINEQGEYELVPYVQVENTPEKLFAFTFIRAGKNYAVYWYQGEDREISLPLTDLTCEEDLGGAQTPHTVQAGNTVLCASHRRYVSTTASVETLAAAFQNAIIL